MPTQMRVSPSYFVSLAELLLAAKGVPDPFGTVYDDARCEIRSTPDGRDVVVRAKAQQDAPTEMVVASRVGGVVSARFERGVLAPHLADMVGLCFAGERVFTFTTGYPEEPTRRRHVEAESLRQAVRRIVDIEPDLGLVAIEAVRTPEAFAAEEAADARTEVTPGLAAARAHAARLHAALGCTDEIYAIAWRDREDGPHAELHQARPIRAGNLAEAESALRHHVDLPPGARIVRVDVETMLEYLTRLGMGAPEPTAHSPSGADA